MLSYTIHEPPTAAADKLDRAEQLLFVREGFSWSAALFGPFWLLGHQLWWALLGYLVVIVGGYAVLAAVGLADQLFGTFALLVNALIGFEGDNLRRWQLARRGWQTVGVVTGRTALECERRFFENWLPDQPYIRAETLRSAAYNPEPGSGLHRPADRGGWWRTAVGRG